MQWISNGYTYVFDAKQNDWTYLNTACVVVSEKSMTAACNRNWIWNNAFISLYAWLQRNANGYTYVLM